MNGKIKPLPPAKIIKLLEKIGFKKIRQKGSHIFMEHPDGRTTIVSFHKGEELGRGMIRKIMKDAEISRGEFFRLIKKL